MEDALRAIAEAARGFMPPDEGLALYDASAAVTVSGPFLEIGSYCGKSAVYLGAAARARGTVLFSVDHHRGSEENQPGWEYHEPDLVDPAVGLIDTLPFFRRTIHDAGLDDVVIATVADSPTLARFWTTPLAFLFIAGDPRTLAPRRPRQVEGAGRGGHQLPAAPHDSVAPSLDGGVEQPLDARECGIEVFAVPGTELRLQQGVTGRRERRVLRGEPLD